MADRDTLFKEPQLPGDFVFDDKVVSVFSDMINRSVPGYATIISMIGVLAERFVKNSSNCYDLGCSLGAATASILHHIDNVNCNVIGVDNSQAMIEKCREVLNHKSFLADRDRKQVLELRCEDIETTDLKNASMVVLNFTLQFVPIKKRAVLIKKVFDGMNSGGLLVLSEKIKFEDDDLDSLFIDMHHRFKQQNGYSELEISQKRAAIENVLIPESIAEHEKRITNAGFQSFDVWFQCFNFASMVAIKQ